MSTLYPDLSLSNFPNSLDQFTTFLNIVASDGPLIAQYQAAMEAGNTTLANQVLAQIPQGTQKIITAVSLNTLSQAMLAIERFYLTDIEPFLQTQQSNWLSVINQFSYKGNWQANTSYVVNNLVTYTVSGINLMYIATSTPPVGFSPANTKYWRVLTIQGPQGESGDGVTYRQEWNENTNYSINDVVSYSGKLWIATASNQNEPPSEYPSSWKVLIDLIVTTYPIQDTAPSGLQNGGLWFNTYNNPSNYVYADAVTGSFTGVTGNAGEINVLATTLNIYEAISGNTIYQDGEYQILDGSLIVVYFPSSSYQMSASSINNLYTFFNPITGGIINILQVYGNFSITITKNS